MATFKTNPEDHIKIKKDDKTIQVLKKDKVDSFTEDILGLGTIKTKSIQTNALSVIFDLEGFTTFCRQIDPQLSVPEYLNDFLNWIFSQIRKEVISKEYPEGYDTYCDLPFLAKYLGDGILFLWDTDNMSEKKIMNVVVSMYEICKKYKTDFLPIISKKVTAPPKQLRCGIARGAIYSVGNGNDFVGPCINMSARLQKLHSLSFCFSKRGFNVEANPFMNKKTVVKKVNIRGIGEDELVCILKDEFDTLAELDKIKFFDI